MRFHGGISKNLGGHKLFGFVLKVEVEVIRMKKVFRSRSSGNICIKSQMESYGTRKLRVILLTLLQNGIPQAIHQTPLFISQPSKLFMDEPCVISKDYREAKHLTGRQQITNLGRFVEKRPGLCFTAVQEYTCRNRSTPLNAQANPEVISEIVCFVSKILCKMLVDLQKALSPILLQRSKLAQSQ
ncbi:hypothetical protein QBC43DRAFT_303430 [Cladorrhinum sp. PSN259]|nr:hypothetical protein QBC43DRAFT_303430 [Cladorrhinum sp. PSN259]